MILKPLSSEANYKRDIAKSEIFRASKLIRWKLIEISFLSKAVGIVGRGSYDIPFILRYTFIYI